MSKIGIINEQGFVAGNNLGFNPLSENETEQLNTENTEKDNKK